MVKMGEFPVCSYFCPVRYLLPIAFLLAGCSSDEPATVVLPEMEPPVLIIHAPVDQLSYEGKRWCDLSFVDDKGDTVFGLLKGRVKYRGGQSSGYPKHSFTIELSRSYDLLGLPADDDWMVLASYSDKSFMRNKISYDLFLQMDQLAPRTEYMNVVQDSIPQGLYLLCERMDAKRLDITRSDTASFIYKDPHIFRVPDTSIAPQQYHNELGAEQKFPDQTDLDKTWLMEHLQQLIYYGSDSAFIDRKYGVPALFDLDNIIDWHLLLLVTNNGDGIAKNFYLYRSSQRSRIKICPWDYDHTFGRMGDNEANWERKVPIFECRFFDRLIELDPDNYVRRLQDRFEELVEKDILTSDHLIAMTEEMELQIEPYVEANAQLWPVDSEFYYDNNSTEDELYVMREWIVSHMDYVYEHVRSLQSRID